tara:strand:+ start:8017 stop:8340 length:324 start_codon:yes stop_codon:yes gene_type:complete
MIYTLFMYCVIKHTYELENEDDVLNTIGEWRHYVYTFDTIKEATSYAIFLITENPLIQCNDYYLKSAIESLNTNRYYQHGKESVAIGIVSKPVNNEDEKEIYEKYLH